MLGQTLGCYHIETELGSGGMGTVYRATTLEGTGELEQGAAVAVKVIHPHLLRRPGFFKRFMQEARVGRRVRHENVVSTYELDAADVDGTLVLFLVMEHVVGRTLRSLLQELQRVPETLLRELARQTAAGLAAIHEAGIVHRDLKPENVLVTAGHEVRIMDLGVARLLEDTAALTEEEQFAGSLLYAAPEQFGSGRCGTPVDLYALGALLYELAAGHSPFQRDDAGGVIRAHLEYVPPALVELGLDVSIFLSEVVSTLLAKDPGGRFPSAAFLRDLLAVGERSPWWSARQQELSARRLRRPSVAVRRETALHGREDDLERLRETWVRATQGEGCTLLLEGEAGIGKTRLLDAFMGEAAAGEAHVLYGAYHPGGHMGGLSAAILEHFGSAHLEEALRPYLAHAPALAPGFAAILRHEPLPPNSDPLKGDALHALTVYVMRGLAAQKPLLWVVDDLQFAGPDSRAVVLSMARAVAGHRVMLLVASRPGLPELEQFTRLPNLQRLHLERLSPREVIELLRDALGSHAVASRLGGSVAYKSDGVPLFVLEMVRSLKEAGILEPQPDGSFVTTRVLEEIEVPSAVVDVVEARLSRFEPEERTLLDVGAVQGYEFDAGLVARVLQRGRIPVLQSLAELERRSGIVRAAGRMMRFDHHQVQEVLYRRLPEALRIEYHAALADAYALGLADSAALEQPVTGEPAVFLATHHLRGSRPQEALPFLGPALDHLEAGHRNELLVALAQDALGHAGLLDAEARVRLLLRRAERLGYLGDNGAAQQDLAKANRHAQEAGVPARLRSRVKTRLGWILLRQGRYPEAERVLHDALALAREVGAPEQESQAMEHLGVIAYMRADYDLAQGRFERARQLAHEAGDARAEGQAVGGLGIVLRAKGLRDEARVCFARHLEVARTSGDRRGVMNALGNMANLLNYQRCYPEAQAAYESALDVAREIGDRGGEAALQGSLGQLLWLQGRLDEARRQYETSLLLDRELGHREGEARMLLNLAGMWLTLGAFDQAERDYDEALTLCRTLGTRLLEAYALLGRANVHTATGRWNEAEHLLQHALEVFDAIGRAQGRARALDALAACRMDAGREQQAVACLGEALAVEGLDAEIAAVCRCRLARLGAGDVGAAERAYEAVRGGASVFQRMTMLHLLWGAGGKQAHLREAHDLLMAVRRRAPAPWRDSMLERVRLHRAIRDAFQARPSATA